MSLMARRKPIDPEIPPTTREDWLGAIKGDRLGARKAAVPNPMTFHVFQSSADSLIFALTDREDTSRLPPCPDAGEWLYFKRFTETGQQK